jgi:ABC transport system ATP-binding/permease protein
LSISQKEPERDSLAQIIGEKMESDATHGTLFSTFSQTDATNRVLLAWAAPGIIIVMLTILICIGLKRKDVRA